MSDRDFVAALAVFGGLTAVLVAVVVGSVAVFAWGAVAVTAGLVLLNE